MLKLQWEVKRENVTLQVGFTIAGMTLKLEEELFNPVWWVQTILDYTIDYAHRAEGEQLANALLRMSSFSKSARVDFSDGSWLSIGDVTPSGAANPPDAPFLLQGWSSGGGVAVIHLRYQELRKWLDAVHNFFALEWAKSY